MSVDTGLMSLCWLVQAGQRSQVDKCHTPQLNNLVVPGRYVIYVELTSNWKWIEQPLYVLSRLLPSWGWVKPQQFCFKQCLQLYVWWLQACLMLLYIRLCMYFTFDHLVVIDALYFCIQASDSGCGWPKSPLALPMYLAWLWKAK